MENPKTPETLEVQNDRRDFGSSGMWDMSLGSSTELVASEILGEKNDMDVEMERKENTVHALSNGGFDNGNEEKMKELGGNGVSIVGIEKVLDGEGTEEDNAGESDLVFSEKNSENEGMEEDKAGELDSVVSSQKVEVSGEGISLFVDFSGLDRDEGEYSKFMGTKEGSLHEAENAKEEVMENESEECEFYVGDVVWVETKNKTWWPGKILDPLEAPELVGSDQRDSLLVGYFGISHVANCFPSQLRPFCKYFDQISGKNKSRSFLGAVEKAVDEFGWLVKLEMTSSCIQRRTQRRLGGLAEYSINHFGPETFLARIKSLAQVVSKLGTLEFIATKNQLLAFYSSLGHRQLPHNELIDSSEAEDSWGEYRSTAKHNPIAIESKGSSEGNLDIEGRGKTEMGFDSGERRKKKSKYLSYPYVNWGQKGGQSETDESKAHNIRHDDVDLSGSSPKTSKGSGHKFWRKWSRKFVSGSNLSGNQEISNASSAELLSQLHFTAIDCLYLNENNNFHRAGQFFSEFRISVFHDESISNGQNQDTVGAAETCSEIDLSSPVAKIEVKKRKRKTLSGLSGGTPNGAVSNTKKPKTVKTSSGKLKTKRLSGLSDVNITIATDDLFMKDSPDMNLLAQSDKLTNQKKREKEGADGIPDLNGSQVASQDKSKQKERKESIIATTSEQHQVTPESVDTNGKQEPGSFFIDLQVSAPHPVTEDIPVTSGIEVTASLEAKEVKNEAGLPLDEGNNSGQKKRKRRRVKATPEEINTILSAVIPDLNKNGSETNTSSAPSPQNSKPQQKRRRKADQALLLTFFPGIPLPSKEDLITKFSTFGTLKDSDIHLSKDSSTAWLVFSKSSEAKAAGQSLEKNNPFGSTLVKFQLHNPSPTTPSLGFDPGPGSRMVLVPHSGEAPPLELIRQNLQMMTSMLEKSGNNLSPEMRAKLEGEIKGLLKKVSSVASPSSGS